MLKNCINSREGSHSFHDTNAVIRVSEGDMARSVQSIFSIQAELCRAMGSTLSQEIVHSLRDGPMSVIDLASTLEISSPTVSRHLTMLRNAGVVNSQREGYKVFYRIANPKIMQVCDLMREVLTEQFGKDSKLMDSFHE
jgi:DNA-binding transcriptional ArsR family regulator